MAKILVLAMLISGILPSLLTAQVPTRVITDDDRSCLECRIRLLRLAEIGAASDPVSLNLLPSAAVLGERILAGPLVQRGELGVYSRAGEFLGTVGRFGKGPKEFDTVRGMRRWGDTVFIFQDLRVTLADSDFEPVRSIRTPILPSETAVLPDGSVLIAHQYPGVVQPRLARVYRDGRAEMIDLPSTTVHIGGIAPSPDGFWVVELGNYTMTEYDFQGRVLRKLQRRTAWLSPQDGPIRDDIARKRPRPWVVGIWEDSDGLLWTTALIPDAHWKPLGPNEEIAFQSVFDTVIEVMDPERGELVASGWSDHAVWLDTGDGFVTTRHRDIATGSVLLGIYRPVLVR